MIYISRRFILTFFFPFLIDLIDIFLRGNIVAFIVVVLCMIVESILKELIILLKDINYLL